MPRRLKVFFHDNCFDGTASAAVFSVFYRDVIDGAAAVTVEGVQHSTGDPFAGRAIDGDDNACVDFRYSPSPAMTWWFDHHRTAFQPARLRDHFTARASPQQVFDPDAPSCTGLITRTLEARHGWRPPPHLVVLSGWAELIDGARFASAAEAISLEAPAMRLAAWVSACRDPEMLGHYVDAIARRPHEEVAAEAWLAGPLASLADERARTIELVERRAVRDGDVVLYDLTGDEAAGAGGFVGYHLFPDARYTISLVRTGAAVKISVGRNPWAAAAPGPDIGAVCERHGGGGHAAVGGVTLALDALDSARAIAQTIRAELLAS